MSGYPTYPGGYQPPTSAPAMPPGGPPAGQFLAAIQSITTALNALAKVAGAALPPATPAAAAMAEHALGAWLYLPEITAPNPPGTGAILYVDAETHALMALKADGTRHILA